MKVTLNQDMSATASIDGGSPIKGTWLAFYDQAFKVELENGQRFLSNYKYALKPYVSSDPLAMGAQRIAQQNVQTDDYDKFYSLCDRTMVGFVQDTNSGSSLSQHHIECFYGVKEASDKPPEPEKPKPLISEVENADGETHFITDKQPEQQAS